jgi:hypothetical protein
MFTKGKRMKSTLLQSSNMGNWGFILGHVPLYAVLSHFYLGQVHEKTGKTPEAINEYQSFLSHFEGSRTKLPQVAAARDALKTPDALKRPRARGEQQP